MVQKIQGESPFQILSSSFSISPSLQNYVLQISADGVNYSDLFTVSAGQTKMCTGMANGSYYRLKNNASEVTVNWRTQCNDGQGGGGSSTYAESAGTANFAEESNSAKLLEGISALPQDANTGDVVAVAPAPALLSTRGTKGLRSANTALGIYQYDGNTWNKIEGGSGETPDFTSLKPVSQLPASGETGEVVALSSETGETITFNVSDVVFGEGEDILEISGDGLHTLTVNAFYSAENQVNVLKFTNSFDEEYLVEDGASAMFPASTSDEQIWTWKAELNNGVVTIKLYDEDNEAYLPLSTSNISLNVCDAKVNGTFVGVYQYDGSAWNEIGGSSAYKIELSTVRTEDYTQQDRTTLNAFFAAFSADTSIADTAYIYADAGIYRCVRYSVTPQAVNFTFEGKYLNTIVDINLHFANNSYSYGGVQDAVRTPDITTLKSVSEIPSNLENGDVFALVTPAVEGTWQNFDASEHPTQVRMVTKSDGTYLLHFDNDNLYTGIDYTAGDPASFDGSGWGLQQDDSSHWHYDNNGYYIEVWVEEEKGEWFIYATMTQGEGGFSMIDAYQLASETQMLVGDEPEKVGVYQRSISSVKVVTVSYPECSDQGDGRWQGNMVKVEITGTPDGEYYLTEYEHFEDTAELRIDDADLWLYDNSTSTNVFSIPITGGTGGGMFSGGYLMVSYNDIENSFTIISVQQELAYNDQGAVVMGDGATDIELAKKSDLPTDNRLVPTGGQSGQLLVHNGDSAQWVDSSEAVVIDNVQSADKLAQVGYWDDSFIVDYEWGDVFNYVGDMVIVREVGDDEVTKQAPYSVENSAVTEDMTFATSATTAVSISFDSTRISSETLMNYGDEIPLVSIKNNTKSTIYLNGDGWHYRDGVDSQYDADLPFGETTSIEGTYQLAADVTVNTSDIRIEFTEGDFDYTVLAATNGPWYDLVFYGNVSSWGDGGLPPIKNIERIYQSDYDDLVQNDSANPDTFYIILPDPE